MDMNLKRKVDLNCDFCIEIEDFTSSKFSEIYGNTKRTIFSDDNFHIIPTIGQLFFGSLLILPKEHYFSFAEIPLGQMENLDLIINYFESKLSRFGKIILFEHGTTPEIGGGCGIYHAHIHMVPIPYAIPPEFLLGEEFITLPILEDALSIGKLKKEYLLYRDSNKNFHVAIPFSRLQSQHFRKKLHEYFNLDIPWDWKDFKFENKMIETIDYLKHSGREMSLDVNCKQLEF